MSGLILRPTPDAPAQGRPFVLPSLPVPTTSLVGRRQEVREAHDLLQLPDVRLVTLTGPSGVGKTRIALSVAAGMEEDFPDGIVAPVTGWLRQPDGLGLALAHTLGVREAGEQSLTDALIEALRSRTMLLILTDRGDWWQACPLLLALLENSPRVKILAIRQSPLELPGERVVQVRPLAAPPATVSDPAVIRTYPAVRLFQERAGSALQTGTLSGEQAAAVAGLCQRLAGLPLAIELAAAHVPEFTPTALLTQLGEQLPPSGAAPDTAQLDATRQAVIAWSVGALAPADRALLRRLSIFTTPFTRDAALIIGGSDLTALLTANLVRRLPAESAIPRFFMPEPIRAYARCLLDAAGETPDLQQRHARYFAEMATGHAAAHSTPGDRARLDALAASYPDLRGALAWLQEHDPDEALYLAGSLFDLWHTTGMYSEGRAWLQRTLALETDATPENCLSALGAAAALALLQGDLSEAAQLVAQELPLARDLGDPYGLLVALINAGLLAYSDTDFATSEAYFQEALALVTTLEAEDPQVRSIRGTVLGNLGSIAMAQGDTTAALAAFTASVEALRAVRYPWAILGPLVNLGVLHLWQGDAALAASLLSEAIDAASVTRDPRQTTSLLLALASLLIDRGQPELGAQLLGTANRLATTLHVPFDPNERLLRERASSQARLALRERAFVAALAAGHTMAADAMLARAQAAITPRRLVPGPSPISPREAEVLSLAASGLTDREIADALFLSQRTVSNHVARSLAKMGVRNRHEAINLAAQMGWLPVGPAA
ncbi:MAG: LuxR C-terminal-related transcriptional regulator [Thermomicrobiales bacterium]